MGKVLLLGLDGASWNVIRPLADEKKLPFLSKVMEQGSIGDLKSTVPPHSAPAWVSLATGKNPGKHGIFSFVAPVPGTYRTVTINSTHIRSKTIWRLLSEHGKTPGSINMPGTFPPEKVDGFMVGGMLSPGLESDFVYPDSLRKTMEKEFSDYSIEEPMHSDRADYLQRLKRSALGRFRLAEYMLNEGLDMVSVVFTETDRVQHFFWSDRDESHPSRKLVSPDFPRAVDELYQYVDSLCQSLHEKAGREYTVIVVSDHGATGSIAEINLNRWLADNGYLSLRSSSSSVARSVRGKLIDKGWIRPLEQVKKRIPMIRNLKLTNVVLGLAQRLDVNWDKTVAYYGRNLGVNLNVQGREPKGIIKPHEYESVRGELIQGISGLEDPNTGAHIFARALRREDVYSGPYTDLAPDIVLEEGMTEDGRFRYTLSDVLRPEEFLALPDSVTGTHSPSGIIGVLGDAAASNRNLSAHIQDIAATTLYALDMPIPEDFDGSPVLDAFSRSHVEENPPRVGPPSSLADDAKIEMDDDEAVAERLKDLGYLS
jgi:predicted AlkP superfamily phosphohydrolase/phosphomutase